MHIQISASIAIEL